MDYAERHVYTLLSTSADAQPQPIVTKNNQIGWYSSIWLFKALALMASISVLILVLSVLTSFLSATAAVEQVIYHRGNSRMRSTGVVARKKPIVSVDPSEDNFSGHLLDQQLSALFTSKACWRLSDDEKFDCCPDTRCSADLCAARQCCWNPIKSSVPQTDAKRSKWPDFSDLPFEKEAEREITNALKKWRKDDLEDVQYADTKSKTKTNQMINEQFSVIATESEYFDSGAANTPSCFFSPDVQGYVLRWIDETSYGFRGLLELSSSAQDRHAGTELKQLMLQIFIETDYRVHIRIADVEDERFVAPYPELSTTSQVNVAAISPKYRVALRRQPFGFAIERTDSHEVIFDTKVAAPLIFADQFIELSARLSTNYLYGLGEHVDRLKHTFQWDRFVMWNSDGWPAEMLPLYGSQPFYLGLESSGNAHGVYFHNSNAMDVLLHPEQSVTWRTIGGVIDLYFFMGPKPGDVVAQYTELVGRPFMPPYWSLGFHLCRYGYKTLERTRYINAINRNAGIPVEVQWNDIDYMDKYKDFTYDKEQFAGLPEFIDELHRDELRYMVMTDPGISAAEQPGTYTPFDLGRDADVFVKNDTNDILIGLVWTGNWTVWPDFTHPKAEWYWTQVIKDFHANIQFDGLWIDMNEPSNFGIGSKDGCPWSSKYERPPYVPPIRFPALAAKTICMTAKQYDGIHYNLHNAYALTESMVTFKALRSTFNNSARPFVISRSNFAGSGKYSGSWNGDAGASWHDLRASIPYLLNFNMFGIPMAGADICGFHSNTTIELCARWSQLGAFYTFSRNHNDLAGSDQDPASMGPVVLAAARQALEMRYRLLPHFYTAFYKAHMFGATVARPLFFEFPNDPVAKTCDWQFLIGSSLLVVPVLEPNVTSVTAYLPSGETWYDLYTGEQLQESGYVELQAPLDKINLVQRGGSVLVQQAYANCTAVMRRNPFVLLVALRDGVLANGTLFWDSGDGYEAFSDERKFNLIEFYADSNQLRTAIEHAGFVIESGMPVEFIRVSGLRHAPKRVVLNDVEIDFQWKTETNVLHLTKLNDRVNLLKPINLSYT